MSHIVEIKTEVRDAAAIGAACRRLQIGQPTNGTATLFSGEATGAIVQLPGWKYPVVFDINSGEARFDDFEGRWGKREELGKFLQMYAVEKCRLESHRKGHAVTEQTLSDGSIKLTVNVGGAV